MDLLKWWISNAAMTWIHTNLSSDNWCVYQGLRTSWLFLDLLLGIVPCWWHCLLDYLPAYQFTCLNLPYHFILLINILLQTRFDLLPRSWTLQFFFETGFQRLLPAPPSLVHYLINTDTSSTNFWNLLNSAVASLTCIHSLIHMYEYIHIHI